MLSIFSALNLRAYVVEGTKINKSGEVLKISYRFQTSRV